MAAEGDPEAPSLIVVGYDRTTSEAIDIDRWTEVARTTLVGEAVESGQLDLIFVEQDEMAELNVTHMGHEGPTDVLSFPLDAPNQADPAHPDGNFELELDFGSLAETQPDDGSVSLLKAGPVHLGDVIVCPEVAARQAPEHCGEIDAELSMLVIHGVLHILGHDHAEPAETAAMQGRERHYLAQLGYGHPESS